MTACAQSGCTGSILDGYCDICGSPVSATPTAEGSSENGTPCRQPDCRGTRVDGYCDVCGSPASMSVPDWDSFDDYSIAQSTMTRGSSRLGSAALGSRRAEASGSKITRRTQSGSGRLRSARLGAGLTRVPPAPEIDAAQAVMKTPEVPENKRNCPSCSAPVGRSRDGRPGRTEGFCPRCRNPYSFTPKLQPGDLVANQYEVVGCLAHGGLGWIYLAMDKNVSNRWVVLKGLLNSGDADALDVAIIEQQFLAQVEHPLIVEIYNFVTYDGAGYIVMEYVGGTSLKTLLKQRMKANNDQYDPLPVDQALAYVLEVLPAFQYLHDLGLVYCDFKPDNLIQVGDAVKLIDLGGVRRLGDDESAIYGTVGYQAPEVAKIGTTIASDIYTIGRTLVVLITEFRGYQTKYVAKLPPVEDTPVFQKFDSLYRLLAKCCAPAPADRFASIDELRLQLLGVLREVVASSRSGTALTSAASVLFEAPAVSTDALDWDQLPSLRIDSTDPQYGWLSNVDIDDPQERLGALYEAPAATAEVQLARARAALELRRADLVQTVVNEMLTEDPWEWRAVWMAGLSALQQKDAPAAQAAFNAVYGQIPGELAPKLALALACELNDEPDIAESLYQICASTDANYVAPAAFGMARLRAARSDIHAAIDALDLVPSTSRSFTQSRRQRAQHLFESDAGLPSLAEAMESVSSVRLDPADRAAFTANVLEKALALVTAKGAVPDLLIGPYHAESGALRDGLEATYRELAKTAPEDSDRYRFVDLANKTRRWTIR